MGRWLYIQVDGNVRLFPQKKKIIGSLLVILTHFITKLSMSRDFGQRQALRRILNMLLQYLSHSLLVF